MLLVLPSRIDVITLDSALELEDKTTRHDCLLYLKNKKKVVPNREGAAESEITPVMQGYRR